MEGHACAAGVALRLVATKCYLEAGFQKSGSAFTIASGG
jgi:hypothetical protein